MSVLVSIFFISFSVLVARLCCTPLFTLQSSEFFLMLQNNTTK
nr:MAG TPA: hypothetical protein [Caudoviricetes sp.]